MLAVAEAVESSAANKQNYLASFTVPSKYYTQGLCTTSTVLVGMHHETVWFGGWLCNSCSKPNYRKGLVQKQVIFSQLMQQLCSFVCTYKTVMHPLTGCSGQADYQYALVLSITPPPPPVLALYAKAAQQ